MSALVAEHPDGCTAAELAAAFPGEDITCIRRAAARRTVIRARRGVYAHRQPAAPDEPRGLSRSPRATLGRFTAVAQSFVDQGVSPRNPIASWWSRPPSSAPPQSWTLAEAQQFRELVRDHRL